VRKRIKDRSFSLGLCGAGDVFGEMSFLSQLPRSADVVALTDLEILVLTPPFLRKAVNNMPKIAAKVLLNLSIILCDRLRTSSQNWVTALSATEGKNG